MRVLIINLPSAKERMAFQAEQMRRLGLEFTRIGAVLADQADAMRSRDYWFTWQRPLRNNEKACMLSHVEAWRFVVAANEPMLILEDDALLSRRLPALLQSLAGRADLDLLNLEVRGKRKLLGREPMRGLSEVYRLYQSGGGAAAYVLWPAGARKLLADTELRAGLADAVLSAASYLEKYQTTPAYALQLDMCGHYDLPAPLQTVSSIGDGGKPDYNIPLYLFLRLKRRRVSEQLGLFFGRIFRFFVARRRFIEVRAEDFSFPA
ncbi:glycosyltransferase family 25 protein [Agrobacterium tumefaciens]|uniref:glycosyltransferase family 25 protein n=1 Tax=Agrobacterium tumefaciens TaxID=358 RepID=UPI00287D7533|nr:glycosyltransferase family 25 protein [Agrobacterium tumefaciens]MDS7597419.1 glycosyltransferase family 25 protein [Agrobacterium tumefaciens]